MNEIETSRSTTLFSLLEKLSNSLMLIVLVITLAVVSCFIMYFQQTRIEMDAQHIAAIQAQNERILQENIKLQNKLDNALIPQATIGEAVSENVYQPAKRKLSSWYDSFVALF